MSEAARRLLRLASLVSTAGHRDTIVDAAFRLYPDVTMRQALDALARDLREVSGAPVQSAEDAP